MGIPQTMTDEMFIVAHDDDDDDEDGCEGEGESDDGYHEHGDGAIIYLDLGNMSSVLLPDSSENGNRPCFPQKASRPKEAKNPK